MKQRKKLISNLLTYGMVIAAYFICQGLIDAGEMSRSLKSMLVPICCYVVMAVSLNLTVGISGELSLGHAGFMAIGAVTGVVCATWMKAVNPDMAEWLRLLLAIVVGGAFAMLFGFLIGIPVLRLRGDYLAIVTLAFGEIIRNLLNMFYFSVDGTSLTMAFGSPNLPGKLIYNGAAGTTGVTTIKSFPAGILLVLFTLVVVLNLINSRTGRAIMATRDNRIAAESVGINVTRYKMIAFVVSAMLAGMAGALFGLQYGNIQSAKFNVDTSILVLVFVVMGGIGSIPGSIIAATALYLLPELLRDFSTYRMLIYAILLILMMIATNNPWIRSVFRNLKAGISKKAKIATDTGKGGEAQ